MEKILEEISRHNRDVGNGGKCGAAAPGCHSDIPFAAAVPKLRQPFAAVQPRAFARNALPRSPRRATLVAMERDYLAFSKTQWPADNVAAMRHFCDVGWDAFHDHGVSWIGFYVRQQPDAQELILAARRDKPACSPIGLHGACGQALLARQPLVVTDVAHLGEGYIACDPRDRSEVVVPLLDATGTCWGVLDVDSFDVGAFSVKDAIALNRALIFAELQIAEFDASQITAV